MNAPYHQDGETFVLSTQIGTQVIAILAVVDVVVSERWLLAAVGRLFTGTADVSTEPQQRRENNTSSIDYIITILFTILLLFTGCSSLAFADVFRNSLEVAIVVVSPQFTGSCYLLSSNPSR